MENGGAYHVDYIKKHTLGFHREHLGFLNETGAHCRLLSYFVEIFYQKHVDKQYLEIDKGTSLNWSYLLVTVVGLVCF
ncbi:hypothetical protein L596_021589 [Steinernema carpocapsae]|uniref:Uncharacterized protein n=1 Tax=Steinernema carpocapsae TaxID=34508 RepID=A0A4V5ZZY6_STECR|nr:hypothetical protein L596_021589 [Steinernema carpocapsae]